MVVHTGPASVTTSESVAAAVVCPSESLTPRLLLVRRQSSKSRRSLLVSYSFASISSETGGGIPWKPIGPLRVYFLFPQLQ